MDAIAAKLSAVKARIEEASKRAGRERAPALVAVSKGHPAGAIREAFAAGQRVFGENYVQELVAKAAELRDLEGIEWHFIGHLQRNKVKDLVPVCHVVHAVDRAELATEIDRRGASAAAERFELLIEVNVAREPQKHGCAPEQVAEVARAIAAGKKLALRGLMTIPPAADDPEASRPWFRELARLAASLKEELGLSAPLDLSMGMSHDFEVAVAEGATLVRVGTDIFGPRPAARGA